MKIFNSIGHALAWVVGVLIPAASKSVAAVEAVVGGPVATALATLAGSKGAAVQSGIEAIAGDVLSAFGAAGEAIAAGGLNIQFDTATVSAIQALYAEIKGAVGGTAVPVATKTVVVAAASATAAPVATAGA